MKQLTFRLICLILLITQISLLNLAQNNADSVNQLPPSRLQQRTPTECESSPRNFSPALGLEYLEKNLALCRAADNKGAVIGLLRTLAYLYFGSREGMEKALKAHQEVLFLCQSMGDKVGAASAMLSIGDLYGKLRNAAKALDYLHKALILSEELNNKVLTAAALENLARFYEFQGNLDKSLVYLEKELKLREELGNKRQLAEVLYRIGSNYRWRDDDLSKGSESLLKSLRLREELGQKSYQLRLTLLTIGEIYREQGYYAQAIEFFGRSLKILEEPNYKNSGYFTLLYYNLSQIAETYQQQGNLVKAIEYYQKTLKVQEARLEELKTEKPEELTPLNNRVNGFSFTAKNILLLEMARILNNIGTNYLELDNYDPATKSFERALQIQQELGSRNAVYTLRNLGKLNQRYCKLELAKEYYQKATSVCDSTVKIWKGYITWDVMQNCAVALSKLGYIYGLQGDVTKGLEFAERAEVLYRKIGNAFYSFDYLFESRSHLAEAYQVLGELGKAMTALEIAVVAFENSRAKIIAEEHRLTFLKQERKKTFELYIDVQMQLHKQRPNKGFDALALQASERFRARLLVELLKEARANIRQGVDPKLLEQEQALQQKLNVRAEQQTRLFTGNYNAEQTAALQKEIDALIAEFQQVKAQIKINSPRYAALTQPQRLTVNEIQRDLLDADTVLLEYALGAERSYLWVVTQSTLKSYELPKSGEIENDVRRVVGLLNDGQRWATDEKINTEYEEASVPLSGKLLPPSVLAQLKGKRLVIVADGALQYLPFGALPLPQKSNTKSKTQKTDAVPLAVEYEIVSLPSASALAVQRRETVNRKPSAKSIAIFADPVFSENDERVAAVKTNQSKVSQSNDSQSPRIDLNRILLERAFNWNAESSEPLTIARLPFTRREADDIFAAAPTATSLKALNFEANRDNVLKRDLSDYQIVHFATHGLLNSEHPELSGIVLSLVNEQGQAIDGFLRLNEIYNMNLSADLVVLSACQTALGKEIRGEGLIGLTRGFMYAGSPRVVASLWKVDDVATAELMKLFYQKMLQEQMRPAAALRAAKIDMWKQKRWNAPFYWAAFELQGEWR